MSQNIFQRAIGARFLDRLAASPRGRAYILRFLVGAEEADEAGVFDTLLARVDDPELNKVVRRHRDDEMEHALVFRACLARQGRAGESLPEPVPVIPYIDRELGGFAEHFVGDRHSVMEAYVLLQVIEERGVAQYPLFADAMEPYDPESAAVIRRVAGDETRHVKYAKAISKRYAPDSTTLASTLTRFRDAEARAFASHGQALITQVVAEDLLAVGPLERLFWRTLAALGKRHPPHPTYTRFATA